MVPFILSLAQSSSTPYLQEFELEKDNKLHRLSYGQKKKTLLSFGLATNSSLMILDEPTNGLEHSFQKYLPKSIGGFD